MTSARARAASLLTLLLLLTAALTALPVGPSRAAATTAASAATPDPAHPYTDPNWFPLRNPAKVGCVYNNCAGPYHGYWAIDFGGNLDDPIYAAGGGVFHVGAINNTCPSSGNTPGTWVWIDHGPAGVTVYEHLNRVLAKDGALVTPATEIGTMGHNGNTAPCHTNYLHMEWRAERQNGTRQPIPAMQVCLSGGIQTYPAALGYSAWNSVPNNQVSTGSLNNTCLPSSWQTPDRPTFSLHRGSRSFVITPSARPAGADAWRDRIEEYHPSLRAYLVSGYHNHYPTTASTTISGLTDGHTYRVTVSVHNSTGWSAWAPTGTIVPGSVPSVPKYRSLTHGSNWATLSWYKSSSTGYSATYQVARHCYFNGAWHSWVYSTVPGYNLSYQWHPIASHMTCTVAVRAHNTIGWSAFTSTHYVTTS